MKSLAENIERLGGELVTGKVTDQQFFEVFETRPDDVVQFGLRVLLRANRERDDLLVHFGTYVGHRFGFSDEHLPVLMELAEAPWHTKHEDVVSGLSKLRAPISVDVLYRTALTTYDYLDDEDDEIRALGVKCIWALGTIATEQALLHLEQLAHCGVAVLERNAVGQLARKASEPPSEPIRALAAKLLEKREYVAGVLATAHDNHDPAMLELGLAIGQRVGFSEAAAEPLRKSARSNFHHGHDQLLAALASIGSADAVRALDELAGTPALHHAATQRLLQMSRDAAFSSELRASARAAAAGHGQVAP